MNTGHGQEKQRCSAACSGTAYGCAREAHQAGELTGRKLVLASSAALLLPLVLAVAGATAAAFVPSLAGSRPAKAAAGVGGLLLGIVIAVVAAGRIRPGSRRESA